MTDQPANDPQDRSNVEPGEGVGRRLHAARLERNLSLERIATQLHLRPPLIEALEHDRYADLPGPVFVSGYIRNYARELGLDPEPLLAAYRAATGQPEPLSPRAPRSPARVKRGGQVGRILVRLMTVAVIAGLAYLFAQWWQNRVPGLPDTLTGPGASLDAGGGPVQYEVQDEPQPLDRAEPPTDGSQGREVPMAEAAGVADTDLADRSTSVQSPSASAARYQELLPSGTAEPVEPAATPDAAPVQTETGDEPTGTVGGEPAPGAEAIADEVQAQDEVVLEFLGPCWVNVRDSTNTFSLTGSMAKGDRRVLGGTPPYSLVLGSTKAVTLTVRGTPFDLSRVSKGNVARFKLDPAELP
jgi:cytoskeleton protein RodZ